jgi:hypothetical protein
MRTTKNDSTSVICVRPKNTGLDEKETIFQCCKTDFKSPPLQTLFDFVSKSPIKLGTEPKQSDEYADPKHSRQILTGEAGAHFTASKLLGWGIPTSLAMAGSPYDLLADVKSKRLVRIQVKTSRVLTNGQFIFHPQRGLHATRKGRFDYLEDDFDLAAFVCFPAQRVIFCSSPVKHISIPASLCLVSEIERETWALALKTRRKNSQVMHIPENYKKD